MFTSHTLADNLGVLVDEDLRFGARLVDASLGEGQEAGGTLGFTVLEGLG